MQTENALHLLRSAVEANRYLLGRLSELLDDRDRARELLAQLDDNSADLAVALEGLSDSPPSVAAGEPISSPDGSST